MWKLTENTKLLGYPTLTLLFIVLIYNLISKRTMQHEQLDPGDPLDHPVAVEKATNELPQATEETPNLANLECPVEDVKPAKWSLIGWFRRIFKISPKPTTTTDNLNNDITGIEEITVKKSWFKRFSGDTDNDKPAPTVPDKQVKKSWFKRSSANKEPEQNSGVDGVEVEVKVKKSWFKKKDKGEGNNDSPNTDDTPTKKKWFRKKDKENNTATAEVNEVQVKKKWFRRNTGDSKDSEKLNSVTEEITVKKKWFKRSTGDPDTVKVPPTPTPSDDQPKVKKSWFKRKSADTENLNSTVTEDQPKVKKSWFKRKSADTDAENLNSTVTEEQPKVKKSWFKKKSADTDTDKVTTTASDEQPKVKKSWFKSKSADAETEKVPTTTPDDQVKTKKSWFKRKDKDDQTNDSPNTEEQPKVKKSWFKRKTADTDNAKNSSLDLDMDIDKIWLKKIGEDDDEKSRCSNRIEPEKKGKSWSFAWVKKESARNSDTMATKTPLSAFFKELQAEEKAHIKWETSSALMQILMVSLYRTELKMQKICESKHDFRKELKKVNLSLTKKTEEQIKKSYTQMSYAEMEKAEEYMKTSKRQLEIAAKLLEVLLKNKPNGAEEELLTTTIEKLINDSINNQELGYQRVKKSYELMATSIGDIETSLIRRNSRTMVRKKALKSVDIAKLRDFLSPLKDDTSKKLKEGLEQIKLKKQKETQEEEQPREMKEMIKEVQNEVVQLQKKIEEGNLKAIKLTGLMALKEIMSNVCDPDSLEFNKEISQLNTAKGKLGKAIQHTEQVNEFEEFLKRKNSEPTIDPDDKLYSRLLEKMRNYMIKKKNTDKAKQRVKNKVKNMIKKGSKYMKKILKNTNSTELLNQVLQEISQIKTQLNRDFRNLELILQETDQQQHPLDQTQPNTARNRTTQPNTERQQKSQLNTERQKLAEPNTKRQKTTPTAASNDTQQTSEQPQGQQPQLTPRQTQENQEQPPSENSELVEQAQRCSEELRRTYTGLGLNFESVYTENSPFNKPLNFDQGETEKPQTTEECQQDNQQTTEQGETKKDEETAETGETTKQKEKQRIIDFIAKSEHTLRRMEQLYEKVHTANANLNNYEPSKWKKTNVIDLAIQKVFLEELSSQEKQIALSITSLRQLYDRVYQLAENAGLKRHYIQQQLKLNRA